MPQEIGPWGREINEIDGVPYLVELKFFVRDRMGLIIQCYIVLGGIKGNIAGLYNNDWGATLNWEGGNNLFGQVDIWTGA